MLMKRITGSGKTIWIDEYKKNAGKDKKSKKYDTVLGRLVSRGDYKSIWM